MKFLIQLVHYLRFVARRELPEATNIARAIGMSTGQATSCQKINGDG